MPFRNRHSTQFGKEGLGVIRSGGWFNSDFSLLRNFDVTEHARLQLRGEFFNAFNHTVPAPPGLVFGTSGFGVVSVAAPPRQIQIGARLMFLIVRADLQRFLKLANKLRKRSAKSSFHRW